MQIKLSPSSQRVILIGTAVFAMLWVVARACVQAITIDEAVTYINFARLPFPSHWAPHGNNHILNSIVMRIVTSIFGASPVTVRSGALFGAAVYIVAAYSLCRLISREFWLRWSLFVCLVYNPFVLDFLVAARGYALAIAFLTCAILVVAATKRRDARWPRSLALACGLASACGALSMVGNFSFAVMDAAAVLMLYVWSLWAPASLPEHLRGSGVKARMQLFAAAVMPGVLVAAVLAGSALLRYNEVQVGYGAMSFRESLQSVYEASMYELSPYIVNPLIYKKLLRWSVWILPVLGLAGVWRLVLIILHRSSLRDHQSRWLLGLGGVLAAALGLTLSLHWTAFRLIHLPLPRDRTALYVAVVCTLFLGIVAAVRIPTRVGELSRQCMTVALCLLAAYFMLCLRIGYFKEWKFDSDIDRVYAGIAYYNHTCGVTDVGTNWRYDAALNYYGSVSGRETFSPFAVGPNNGLPVGKRAYVVFYPEDEQFVQAHGLKAVYRAPSDATIVIDPAQMPPGREDCLAGPPGSRLW